MRAELEKLIDLQISDTNLRRLKMAIESAQERRATIEQEFEQHAFSIREIQNRRDTYTAERTDFEKQIAENKTYLERADRNLKHAQNSKEYETAIRETGALQKQISDLETKDLEKMAEIEEVEKELAERADEINSLDKNRAEALKAFDAELATQQTEFDVESKKREKVFTTLPTQLAGVYNRLAQRSRDGIAVAAVVKGACSACFMSLRPQMQVNVRKGDEIITCESCSRILYIPVEKSAGQEANTGRKKLPSLEKEGWQLLRLTGWFVLSEPGATGYIPSCIHVS